MSHLSNGSSPSGSGHSNCHNYTNGDVDYHKIAQICLAGLREASNGQKEMCERCDVLEQSIAELRSDMDLRISPLESSHQAMHTLLHENETLKHSLTLLSKSIDPAWKASIEARLTNHDLLAQKLQQMEEHMTAMARLLEAKTERTSGMNLDPSHVTSSPQTQRPVSHVPLPVLAAPSTSNPSLSSPVASPRSGTQAASPKPVTPPKAVHSPTVPLDKVVIEQVINKKSQYAEVLSACSDMLVNLGKASGNEGQLDEMLEQDLSALSRIDRKPYV